MRKCRRLYGRQGRKKGRKDAVMLYYTMPRAVTNYAGATPLWSHRRRVVDSSRNCTVLLWEKKPPDTCVRVLCARSVLLYSTVQYSTYSNCPFGCNLPKIFCTNLPPMGVNLTRSSPDPSDHQIQSTTSNLLTRLIAVNNRA